MCCNVLVTIRPAALTTSLRGTGKRTSPTSHYAPTFIPRTTDLRSQISHRATYVFVCSVAAKLGAMGI